jgi:hypothetical protein
MWCILPSYDRAIVRPDGLATVLTDAALAGWPAMSQFENAMYVIAALAVVVLVMGLASLMRLRMVFSRAREAIRPHDRAIAALKRVEWVMAVPYVLALNLRDSEGPCDWSARYCSSAT